MMSNILVVGSINMDLITVLDRFPKVGETLLGQTFTTALGGKGANQAVAAARLGADVAMIGAVGDDANGTSALNILKQEGIDISGIGVKQSMSSGIASITVAESDNHIIVVPGANFALSIEDIDAHTALFEQADVVLCQLEIPMDCVLHAAKLAKKHQATFVLNPAPAQKLSAELLSLVDVMTPNHTELKLAFALDDTASDEEIAQILPVHMQLVMTEGANGASHYGIDGKRHWNAFKVEAVDTTGAGDTFNAGLAVYWSQGLDVAVERAQAAAALAVQQLGAQTAMPTAEAVSVFIQAQA
ncbi:ribokinase [Vitreoscilla stercoraria]